jgi:DNA repair protein RadC
MTPAQIAARLERDPDMLARVRRMLRPRSPAVLDTHHAAERAIRPYLDGQGDERILAIYIDRTLRPLEIVTLTTGNDQYTVVCPRQIFRKALEVGASYVIMAHNHPSGNPEPSPQDLEVTRRVLAAGQAVGIQLVDHLIIGDPGYVSLAQRGHCDGIAQPAYTTR